MQYLLVEFLKWKKPSGIQNKPAGHGAGRISLSNSGLDGPTANFSLPPPRPKKSTIGGLVQTHANLLEPLRGVFCVMFHPVSYIQTMYTNKDSDIPLAKIACQCTWDLNKKHCPQPLLVMALYVSQNLKCHKCHSMTRIS